LPLCPKLSRRNLELLLCLSTVLILGIGLMAFGWSRARTDVRLDQRNAIIEGKVMDGSISTGMRGGQWSQLEVEYQPANHSPVRRRFDVDSRTYKAGLDNRKVTVTYLPEDPQISRVTRFSPLPYQILIWVGGIMGLGGLIALICFMKTRTKAREDSKVACPQENGEWTWANQDIFIRRMDIPQDSGAG